MTPLPSWQARAGVPSSVNPGGKAGRGVPDVAGDADPATGYNIVLNSQTLPVGGTSAVAPLWAGLIARINQQLGRRVGFINPKLYALPAGSPALRDVTTGGNRVSSGRTSEVGYDAAPRLGRLHRPRHARRRRAGQGTLTTPGRAGSSRR